MTQLDLYDNEYSPRTARMPYGISAGGVVYKKTNNTVLYLLLGRHSKQGISYHLPKGTLHIGEPIEAAAIREIAEEAGVRVKLKTFIGGKHARFDYMGAPNDKIILYYVAEYIDEASGMDDEHDFREWCSYDDAINKLSANIKHEDEFLARANDFINNK